MRRGSRRLGLRAAAVAAAALACAEVLAQQSLPPGPGRMLLLESCVQCHDLRPVTTQAKGEAAWRRTVNEMIWRGAPLLPGEADVITRYLAASFGPTPAARTAGAMRPSRSAPPVRAGSTQAVDPASRALPPGPGRALVLKACVGCHDLQTSVAPLKTPEEWLRSVDLMVRLGARLEAAEISAVADYLSSFRGRTSAPGQGGGRP